MQMQVQIYNIMQMNIIREAQTSDQTIKALKGAHMYQLGFPRG